MDRNLERPRSDGKPFLDHLEDLRWTILKMLAALVIGIIITAVFVPRVFDILQRPLIQLKVQMGLSEDEVKLVAWKPSEGMTNIIKIALFAGLVVAFPAMLYFLVMFIVPALTSRERRVIIPGLVAGTGLFALGLLFCYFVSLPMIIRTMWKINERFGLRNVWTLSYYLSFITGFLFANGLIFELPLVLFILVKLNILTVQTLRRGRRHAIVIMFIVGAILSPPDPGSMFLVALPMVILYEASIWVSVLTTKREREDDAEEETDEGADPQ